MSRAREAGQQLAASYYGFDGFPEFMIVFFIIIIIVSSCAGAGRNAPVSAASDWNVATPRSSALGAGERWIVVFPKSVKAGSKFSRRLRCPALSKHAVTEGFATLPSSISQSPIYRIFWLE